MKDTKTTTFWTKLIFGLVIGISLLKLWKLNGGLIFGEPDEWVYQEISQNFAHTLKPIFEGRFFFDSPPLFTWLGFFLSRVITDKFIALRLISLVSATVLAWLLFVYLKPKLDFKWAVFGVLLLLILPITTFYSRLGLIEMLLALFSFLTFILAEKALKRNKLKISIWAGVSLALVLMTKFTGVIIVVSLLIYFLTQIITFSGKKITINKEPLKISLVVLATAAVILTVFFGGYLLLGRGAFISAIKGKISSVNYVSPQVYLDILTRVLTLEFSLLAAFGLLTALIKRAKNLLFPGLVVVIGLYFIARLPTERYFVMLVPFMIILVVNGVHFFFTYFRLRNKPVSYVFLILLTIFIFLPKSFLAFKSSYHLLAPETAKAVASIKKETGWENKWVFSNYWPSAFVTGFNYKTTWLSSDLADAQAFSTIPNQYSKISADPFTTLKEEGGIVVLEELYSSFLSKGDKRIKPRAEIKRSFQPSEVIVDNNPNWPFFTQSQNQVYIYKVK